MVTERDWAGGFLAQARADLEAARVLITQNAITASGASVFSMLLQMAFEKFVKAALLRSGAIAFSPRVTARQRQGLPTALRHQLASPSRDPWY